MPANAHTHARIHAHTHAHTHIHTHTHTHIIMRARVHKHAHIHAHTHIQDVYVIVCVRLQVLGHYKFEADEIGMVIFLGVVPVVIEVFFKNYIFTGLNRISPPNTPNTHTTACGLFKPRYI